MFKRETSGLILIPTEDFTALIRDNDKLRQSLEEQRAAPATAALNLANAQLTAYHYEAMLTLMREKQALSERLNKAETELTARRAET